MDKHAVKSADNWSTQAHPSDKKKTLEQYLDLNSYPRINEERVGLTLHFEKMSGIICTKQD